MSQSAAKNRRKRAVEDNRLVIHVLCTLKFYSTVCLLHEKDLFIGLTLKI